MGTIPFVMETIPFACNLLAKGGLCRYLRSSGPTQHEGSQRNSDSETRRGHLTNLQGCWITTCVYGWILETWAGPNKKTLLR